MMEHLFRLTELEVRVPLNMNVLVDGVVPRVVGLKEALGQWLDHRRTVLVRQSRHRLGEIARRLEVLAGMLIVFLHLDEVIRIIREEDDPKASLKSTFDLSDIQADYVLDTRLRALRRLEEMQIRKENDKLVKERDGLDALVASEPAQWRHVASQIREIRKAYGPETPLGRRRTSFEALPHFDATASAQGFVEREPVTVVVTQKGWIRTLKGHGADLAALQFKGDDSLRLAFPAETTGRVVVLATDGKVFTLEVARLPGGRGFGEPLRLMADLGEGEDVAAVLPFEENGRVLIASGDGRGFVAAMADLVVGTRKGKALLAPTAPAKARLMVPARGDHVAVVSNDRHMAVFPLAQVPTMSRGKGVKLQRAVAGLSDLRVFALAEGLRWQDASGKDHVLSQKDILPWMGNRADRGRQPPRGFRRDNRFGE